MSTRSRTIWLVIIGALLTASFSTTLAHLATQWSGRPQSPLSEELDVLDKCVLRTSTTRA